MLPKPNPSATILYASPNEMESHLIRLVMAEKNIEREVINLKIDQMPEEILELNPCEILPTLFDRGMVLYDLHVLTEYLDERFPFPPLFWRHDFRQFRAIWVVISTNIRRCALNAGQFCQNSLLAVR